MLLAYFRQIWEQAKKEGYAFIFETCNLQRGDRLNRFLAGEDEDDDSIKVEGPFEQDSLYIFTLHKRLSKLIALKILGVPLKGLNILL